MSIIDVIKNFCEDNGYDLREDYSGRGMFGRSCIGIVGDFNPLHLVLCLADVLRDEEFDNAEDILGRPCQDSMGLSTIVYFPSLNKEEEE